MLANRSVAQFTQILLVDGPSAALLYLNDGVPHRYSAVYRIEEATLINVALHDKAGEMRPEFLAEVPFDVSFCQFVIRDGLFRTDDSATDHRLDGHPYQGVMLSYHGVPIIWQGEVWGTVCHFDIEARPLPAEEFDLLQAAAAEWSRALPVEPTSPGQLGER
jgi:GAF domain-containing protein